MRRFDRGRREGGGVYGCVRDRKRLDGWMDGWVRGVGYV